MTTPAELKSKMFKALKGDRTAFVGLDQEGGLGQPMTAQFDDDRPEGPIYFFSGKDTDLVEALGGRGQAVVHFAAKGHDLFATLAGDLVADNDRATIDRLWNPFVAAWFEGGKDDPKLQLLRFEPHTAQVWENAHSLLAGAKMLLGRDPKEDYADKTAHLRL